MKLFKRKTRAERNEANQRRFMRKYQPASGKQKIQLIRVFTDRNDQNYYVAANIGHITRERAIKIEESLLALEYGIKRDEVVFRLDKIKTSLGELAFSKVNPATLRSWQKKSLDEISDLMYRMENIQHEDLIINAGLYMIYMDGENPYLIDNDLHAEKFERVKMDEELRDFFLDFTEGVLKSLANGKE